MHSPTPLSTYTFQVLHYYMQTRETCISHLHLCAYIHTHTHTNFMYLRPSDKPLPHLPLRWHLSQAHPRHPSQHLTTFSSPYIHTYIHMYIRTNLTPLCKIFPNLHTYTYINTQPKHIILSLYWITLALHRLTEHSRSGAVSGWQGRHVERGRARRAKRVGCGREGDWEEGVRWLHGGRR